MSDDGPAKDSVPSKDSVLVVRVWFEPHRDPSFRARLLAGDAARPTTIGTMSSPEHVVDAVRRWLADYCEQENGRSR